MVQSGHKVTMRAGLVGGFAFGLLLSMQGCGGGAPAPTPTPAPTCPLPPIPAAEPESMQAFIDIDQQMQFLQKLQEIADDYKSEKAPNGTRHIEFPDSLIRTRAAIESEIAKVSSDLKPKEFPYWDGFWNRTADEEMSISTAGTGKTFQKGVDMWAVIGATSTMSQPITTGISSVGNTSGMDWDKFTEGNIALVELLVGGNSFCNNFGMEIMLAAKNASAAAIVLVSSEDDQPVWPPGCGQKCTLEDPPEVCNIPFFYVRKSVGDEIAAATSITFKFSGETVAIAGSANLCIDLPGGSPDKVVMVGALYDVYDKGSPGANYGGSGPALVLDLVRAFAKRYGVKGDDTRLQQTLRVCWFSSFGIGAPAYVAQLNQNEQNKILGYMHFEEIASRNGVNVVLNGTYSDKKNPKASGFISDAIFAAFKDNNAPVSPPFGELPNWDAQTDDSRVWVGWSVQGHFAKVGIPIGDVYSLPQTKKGLMTEPEAEKFCGKVNAPYDSCEFKACDTPENIDQNRQLLFSRVAAQVVQKFLEDATLPDKLKRENLPPPPKGTAALSLAGAEGDAGGVTSALG